MKIKSVIKIFLKIIIALLILSGLILAFWLKGFPFLVSNEFIISSVEKSAKKYVGIDIDLQNPKLKTYLSPKIEFGLDLISLNKNNSKLLEISKLDCALNFNEIFKKVIVVDRFGADNIYADVNKLMQAFPAGEKQEQNKKSDWIIDLYDSVLYLNKSFIVYYPQETTKIELTANDLNVDNREKIERFVHFNLNADIFKDSKKVNVSIKDDNKIVIKNKHIYVENCPLVINYSKMYFNAQADRNDYEVNIFAKKFFIPDLIKLLETNVVENNIKESLSPLKNLNGDFDFNIKLLKSGISGDIKFNKISAKLIPLAEMPFIVNSGTVLLKGNDLILQNFKGYYDNKKSNELSLEGTVKDYLKTMKTNIVLRALLTNDFFSKYLSKTTGVNLTLKGKSQSKTIIDVEGSKTDITAMGKIAKGDDILVEGASLSPVNYDRALTANLHLNGDILNIETIKYYIAKELNKQTKGVKPIITLDGNLNIINGKILDLGFQIPNPLPSEFLNVLIGQKMFKKGKFYGDMRYVNTGRVPVIEGNLQADKVLIPPQRMFLKSGRIYTENNLIKVEANGKYRRCGWEFNGNILNEIVFPIIIKNTSLVVDDINIARIMRALNSPVQKASYNNDDIESDDDSNNLAFDPTNLIIENAKVKIQKGSYNEINFSNVEANMSLDKQGIFKLTSNMFDIAGGQTNAKVNCDLKNHKYYIRLGIKEVDSDIMSTAILNLKREIAGKASGLIELNTDDSLKLNGNIKFLVSNGAIQKVGLVQYVLNFASVFRNPLTMISPSIFSDIINIPEGNFDKITGELKLKNNVIELIKIKSYSPQLSAFIIGKYDLENSDAILRIYTKFSNKHKGVGGFLRSLSLNSLANRIPLKSRNDANYYSAELEQLPDIEAEDKDCQVFLTKVDGDVEHNNFISSLKKIK